MFIEHGSRFNPNWHTGQVIQTVVSNGNMSYTTTCNNLEADKTYLLQFNWAAHVGVPLKEQSAIVRWNGAAIITITPTD